MAFADPLPSINLNAVAQTLNRTSTSGRKSTYEQPAIDATHPMLTMTISHSPGSLKTRSVARIDEFLDVNADNILENLGVWLVIEKPTSGFTIAQQQQLARLLIDALTASSDAALLKLIGLQS